MQTVYFDYNATTPLDPQARAAMLPFLDEVWGNPSSVHHVGRHARARLDEARERAAKVLGSKPSEVVFTSGGTESANLAILGTARLLKPKGRHIITSAIEHHAVLRCCEYLAQREGFEVTFLPVNREGLVSPDSLAKALRPDTILVSVMAANNEIGTVQPVAELGALCRQHGVLFHTDAVQWFGKEPFEAVHQFNADLVSICAHKIHGPKEALERFVRIPVFDRERLAPLTGRLIQLINRLPGVQFVGSRERRLANTVAFVVEGSDSIPLLAGLDLEGICASSGSACSAGSLEPSHVVEALGLKQRLTNSLIRFSLGRDSTLEEVALVERVLPEVICRAQPIQ
jgi:cysteine desulfurase